MAPVRRKEFCPSYFAELVGPTRARYEAKISMCDGVDPYTLCAGTDTTTDVELLPVTTHADIVNYLVLCTNHVSLTEMKAYMSLEAHNYFTSGRVSGVTAKRLPSKRVIVLSEAYTTRAQPAAANELWRSLLEYLTDPEAPAIGIRLHVGRDSQSIRSQDAH
ncbi:hypothetical protein HPB52_005087 [Rhipicephalus sanguineus]|uniref:Uncharacterized protein n=2 Tax=Rhipicephalus sanguineus TaxID=34632 RepID=A0A9D4QI66_RHISA|nr:hypothetical protein HPB52_005087 [Rhipicephalus sanguineus]